MYKIYTRLPNWHRNKIKKSYKTSAPLTNALGILIVNKPKWIMFSLVGTNASRNALLQTKQRNKTNWPMQNIQQTRIKSNHKCNLINTCNRINTHQSNKPVANHDRVKYHQLNKSKTGTITKSYKMDSWRGHYPLQ